MNGRCGTARSKTMTTLGVAAAAGIVAGIVGVSGAGTASARPVSLTLDYTCTVGPWISEKVPMRIHTDIPDSVAAGTSSPQFTLDAATTVSKDETHLIHTYLGSLKSVEGTVDAQTQLHSPDGDFSVPVHFGVHRVTIPGSDRAFDVTATGTAPPHTFHRTGIAQVTVGDLSLKLLGRKANGQTMGPVTLACRLDTHPQPVVASFRVTGTGQTSGSPTPGASGAGVTTGSPSAGASAPPASTGSGTAAGTMANTGQNTRDLILLTVGTLAAGGGLLLAGARLKRRRAGDA